MNPPLRFKVIRAIVWPKEAIEIGWMTYGALIYFSDDATGCSYRKTWEIVLMSFLLIWGALKVLMLVFVFISMIIYAIHLKCQKRNQRSASRNLLRSLTKMKYSALGLGQREPDQECSICC